MKAHLNYALCIGKIAMSRSDIIGVEGLIASLVRTEGKWF